MLGPPVNVPFEPGKGSNSGIYMYVVKEAYSPADQGQATSSPIS